MKQRVNMNNFHTVPCNVSNIVNESTNLGVASPLALTKNGRSYRQIGLNLSTRLYQLVKIIGTVALGALLIFKSICHGIKNWCNEFRTGKKEIEVINNQHSTPILKNTDAIAQTTISQSPISSLTGNNNKITEKEQTKQGAKDIKSQQSTIEIQTQKGNSTGDRVQDFSKDIQSQIQIDINAPLNKLRQQVDQLAQEALISLNEEDEKKEPTAFQKINHVCDCLAQKSAEELKALYLPHLPALEKLVTHIKPMYNGLNVFCSGVGALNRTVLSDKTVQELMTPEVLIAMFALFIAKPDNKGGIIPGQKNLFEKYLSVQAHFNIHLPSIIYKSLETATDKFTFSCLPPNAEDKGESNLEEEKDRTWLIKYIQQKEQSIDFLKKIDVFFQAHGSSQAKFSSTKASDWKNILNELPKELDALKENDLLNATTNAGNWHPDHLITQSLNGLEDIAKKLAVPVKNSQVNTSISKFIETETKKSLEIESSFKDFVDKFSKSSVLLRPSLSHQVDPLHLLVALSTIGKENPIKFSDGQYSIQAFYLAVINTIKEDPLLIERAIVTEQFVARLRVIQERLKKFVNPK